LYKDEIAIEKEVLAKGVDPFEDEYVLCWLPEKKEFASWFLGIDGVTNERIAHYHGRYFKSFEIALKDFKQRICLDDEDSQLRWEKPMTGWNEDQIKLYVKLRFKK